MNDMCIGLCFRAHLVAICLGIQCIYAGQWQRKRRRKFHLFHNIKVPENYSDQLKLRTFSSSHQFPRVLLN